MIRVLGAIRLALAVLVAIGFGATGVLAWSSRGWSAALWTPLLITVLAGAFAFTTRAASEAKGSAEAVAVGLGGAMFLVLLAFRDWSDPIFGVVVVGPLFAIGALRWRIAARTPRR